MRMRRFANVRGEGTHNIVVAQPTTQIFFTLQNEQVVGWTTIRFARVTPNCDAVGTGESF